MKILLIIISLFCSVPIFAYTPEEVVAAVIIREAGGEGPIGMQAVANVILNRANNKKQEPFYVVTQKSQFATVSSEIIEAAKVHPRWQYALNLSEKVANKNLEDLTDGANHFYSGTQKPYWAKKMQFKVKIGGHYFLKGA